MVNRNKCERMYVWNDDATEKYVRIVILVNDDGSCVAVRDAFAVEFLAGNYFQTESWKHCEYTPGERRMTPAQVMGFMVNTTGVIYRNTRWKSGIWKANPVFASYENPDNWVWRTSALNGDVGPINSFKE